MKKILVIGGNGSGKTTFAKVLSEELNIPLVHIDKIARTDNWKRVSEDISKLYFFKAILNFNRNNRKRYYNMLNSYPDVNVIVFKNRKQVDEYIKSVRRQ